MLDDLGQGLEPHIEGDYWVCGDWSHPIVSGGEGPVTAPVVDSGQGQNDGTTETQEDSGLASPFLEAIPEADREIVGRYVKHWDQNVTRKFDEIHSKYKPYEEIGADPTELQQAYQLFQAVSNDPKQVYDLLAEEFGPKEAQQIVEGEQNKTEEDIFAQMPPELKSKFEQLDKHDQVLEMLAQYYLTDQQTTQQQQEDAELEEVLKGLREKHGNFNEGDEEDFVLMKMQQGVDPDKAVEALKAITQGKVNEAAAATSGLPPILSGGGSIAQPPVDPAKLTNHETKNLVAELLRQAHQNQ